MKKPVIMLIDDAPIPEVTMARAAEHHVRTSEFGRLCNEGHVRVLQTENPESISVEIEGEVFTDLRGKFPTTKLMARLQLAIAAGQSCRNLPKEDIYHAMADAMHSSMAIYGGARGGGARDFNGWLRSDAVDAGYRNASKITAAVKKKGLRP